MPDDSAIPSDLTGWAYRARGMTKNLDGLARQLNQAIEDFNAAEQSPRFIGPIGYAGTDVLGYAARNGVVDDWVGQVGQAFAEADHKGVPPQIYRANSEVFFTGLNSASEADLAKLVGDDPMKQADDAAQGAMLAAQLGEAEDSGDAAQIQALISQLKGKRQEYAYAFFNELGPDQTIKTLIQLHNLRDPDLLAAFDDALAKATNDPNWDPSFTSALLDPERDAWDDSYNIGDIQLDMLRYGTGGFSEDFLTQAGDYFLFSGKVPGVDASGDRATIVFNALDRNPDAAYDYLTGHYQAGDENLPRVQFLLRHSNLDYTHPDENQALGRLIKDAGLSQTGRDDYGVSQLLQDIGSIDTQNEVDDNVRQGIADLLSDPRIIGQFAGDVPPEKFEDGKFTWQERLFMIAEMNGSGEIDEGRMKEVQDGVTKYLLQNMPPSMTPDAAQDWFSHAGNLYGLMLLPARKAGWNEYDLQKAQTEGWKTMVEFATGFLPEWAHQLEDVPLTAISAIGRSYLEAEPGEAQLKDYELYQNSSAALISNLVMAMAARNDNFFPPALQGLGMDDPRVQEYTSAIMDTAAKGGNPTFPSDLHLSPAEQQQADQWASAVSRLGNQVKNDFLVPTDGFY